MQLDLKAKHYKGATYIAPMTGCPVERAYFEVTGHKADEYVFTLVDRVSNKQYTHEAYRPKDFKSDKLKAAAFEYDERIIRTITLSSQCR